MPPTLPAPSTKPSFDLNDNSNRIIAGIVIALVFIGGWWLIARNASTGDATDGETASEVENATGAIPGQVNEGAILGPIAEDTPIIAASNESIDVADQPAGMGVKVRSATLVQVGWIAVRDANGRTLGAGRFEPGTHADVEVSLLRATEAGQSYQALIYVDDGDKAFDLHKDILVTGPDGSVAGDVFSAQ
ncbi:hypothetical protein A2853_00745 [Candidatus Kaiserbacteria bacterium RIFCSPHIGHO2_01_FULL_55_17]|uniref:DUF7282 domain-containing protein n=1 Tax=Candidatus Kaiserbacteria bacterium RIFCSPHIGHO2_01_FULL_55_17 TaxID=1798484 RepID=A0A1F6D988_9BACT|nr:MAG: hypothetical protein A2853_00745 [Candidatus Kaiserbacteria bacterium RIFCSPHIGHO2_01_FULL_55_17]